MQIARVVTDDYKRSNVHPWQLLNLKDSKVMIPLAARSRELMVMIQIPACFLMRNPLHRSKLYQDPSFVVSLD